MAVVATSFLFGMIYVNRPARIPENETPATDAICATGSLVELTKLRSSPHPWAPPGNWDDYPIGSSQPNTSLPVDYVLEGTILEAPRVGHCVVILRTSRNGVKADGLFQSTEVVQLTADGFRTRNSIYRVKLLSSSEQGRECVAFSPPTTTGLSDASLS